MRLVLVACALLALSGCSSPMTAQANQTEPEDGSAAAPSAAQAEDPGQDTETEGQGEAAASVPARAGPVAIRWAGSFSGPDAHACVESVGCGGSGVGDHGDVAHWELNGSALAWSPDITIQWDAGVDVQMYTSFALVRCASDEDVDDDDGCDIVGEWAEAQGTSPLRLQAKLSGTSTATHARLFVFTGQNGADGVWVQATAGQAFTAEGTAAPA